MRQVRYLSSDDTLFDEIFDYIISLHRRRGMPSPGIVYCRSRQSCDELSSFLRGKGIGAKPYHKGIPYVGYIRIRICI